MERSALLPPCGEPGLIRVNLAHPHSALPRSAQHLGKDFPHSYFTRPSGKIFTCQVKYSTPVLLRSAFALFAKSARSRNTEPKGFLQRENISASDTTTPECGRTPHRTMRSRSHSYGRRLHENQSTLSRNCCPSYNHAFAGEAHPHCASECSTSSPCSSPP